MTIKQLGPNRWKVRVQFRDKKTGRKRSLEETVTGPKREASRVLSELQAEALKGGSRAPRQRLKAYAASWIASRAGSLKPSVARRYAFALDLHILPVLGEHYMDALTTGDVQAYVSHRVGEKAAGNTVLNELRILRTMARDSVAEGVAPRNWADRVKAPPVHVYTEDAPNLLTAEELSRLLAAVPEQWRQLVILISFTGLRWGEASGLKYEDIDADKGLIHLRRQNWRGIEVTPKTSRSRRTIPLPPIVIGKGKGYIFKTKGGTLHKGSPLRAILDEACTVAKVPRVTPHGLRRTFNNLARQVAAQQVVKSITGHTTDAMFEHYSMVGRDEKRLAQTKVRALVEATTTVEKQAPDGAGVERDDDAT